MKCNTVGWYILSLTILGTTGCANVSDVDASDEHLHALNSTKNTLAALAHEDGPEWSPVVDGLRARLRVLPSAEPDLPFCQVFIEFENVDDVAGQKIIRFDMNGKSKTFTFQVVDQNDKPLAHAHNPYDGMMSIWEPIALPFHGMIGFQISFPGSGYSPDSKVMLDVGPDNVWDIPQGSTTYYLSGTFAIELKESGSNRMDWSGTLKLPKTEIPRAKIH